MLAALIASSSPGVSADAPAEAVGRAAGGACKGGAARCGCSVKRGQAHAIMREITPQADAHALLRAMLSSTGVGACTAAGLAAQARCCKTNLRLHLAPSQCRPSV